MPEILTSQTFAVGARTVDSEITAGQRLNRIWDMDSRQGRICSTRDLSHEHWDRGTFSGSGRPTLRRSVIL